MPPVVSSGRAAGIFIAAWNACGAMLEERGAADLSTSCAPVVHSVIHMVMHKKAQDIVQNRISGTKYSGVSGQVKSIYLLSKG